jgi:hypothetical protein
MRVMARTVLTAVLGVVLAAYSVAPAQARPTAHTVRIGVPAGSFTMAPGLHSMWAVRTDEFDSTLIVRINPATDRRSKVANLDFASGGFAVGFGSLWISSYYGNTVWRVSPSGRVQARIGVGLQPEVVHVAFGSVWVADHHGASVTRIDPRTNGVIATDSAGDPTDFRDGPQGIANNERRIFVGSSNLFTLQSIDPDTNLTTTPAGTADTFCGPLTWVGAHVWSPDNCSNTVYQFAPDGTVIWSYQYGPTSGSDVPQVLGSARLGNEICLAVDRHFNEDTFTGGAAALQCRNPRSGALLRHLAIGGDASMGVFSGYGSRWVPEAASRVIKRVNF